MIVENLIKELDPEYHKCLKCKRLMHISRLNIVLRTTTRTTLFECKNYIECDINNPLVESNT